MKLIVTESYDESSRLLADMVEAVIAEKKDAVIGCATGSSPIGMYRCLAEDYQAGKVDFAEVHTINLDEYVGLPREHKQSFGYFMDQHLFSLVNIKRDNIMLINGIEPVEEQVEKYEKFLSEHMIDIQILGIGGNGHIGFNEPGSAFIAHTHEVELTQETIQANARFFETKADVPRSAITMGVAGIVGAGKVVLIASGPEKADAVKRLFADDQIDPALPCSILKVCRDVTVVVDRELGRLL